MAESEGFVRCRSESSFGRCVKALGHEGAHVAPTRVPFVSLPSTAARKVYPRALPWELEPHYSRHVEAMAAEGLHSKADIAEQLALRDKRVAEIEDLLKAAFVQLSTTEHEHLMVRGRILKALEKPEGGT